MTVSMLKSLLRYIVVALGGGAASVSDSDLERAASALLIIAPIVWSLGSKLLAARKAPARVAEIPHRPVSKYGKHVQ